MSVRGNKNGLPFQDREASYFTPILLKAVSCMETSIKTELGEIAEMVAKAEMHAAQIGSGAIADRLMKVRYEVYNIEDTV